MGIDHDLTMVLKLLWGPERAQAEIDRVRKAKAQAPRPAPRVYKPRQRTPDGLKTLAEGAAKLGCSLKTLKGHIASGALPYVALGHGSKRQRKMLTDADLDAFVANQTRQDAPTCPSIKTRARRIGNSTSGAEVIAFTAAPKPRPGVKPKP